MVSAIAAVPPGSLMRDSAAVDALTHAQFTAHLEAISVDLRAIGPDSRATVQPSEAVDPQVLALRVAALPKLTQPGGDGGPPELAMGATLGEGGMGVVRSARQLALGREVAVKTLRKGDRSPELVRKLLHEAMIAASLEHPDILPVYALGQSDDGAPMLVMKRVDGTSWHDVLLEPEHPLLRQEPREPLVWHLEVLMRVCHAMAYAHGKGILHRDLKMDNVMVGRFGEVYVLDWGIAVAFQGDTAGALPQASKARGLAGTPCAMAPEMVQGDGSLLSERTDVFLLGAILHEILTGRPRHSGSQVFEVLYAAHLCEDPQFPPDTPEELAAICSKATARDPDQRYASAAEMRRDIAVFLQHRSSVQLLEQARGLIGQVEQAERQLRSGGAGDSVARHRASQLFAEARFALRSALQAWPGNAAASASLQELLRLRVETHLLLREPEHAEPLLEELDPADPGLHGDVHRQLDEIRAEKGRLAALARDYDPQVGAMTRSFMAALLAIGWALLPLAVRWAGDNTGYRPSQAHHVAGTLIFAAFMAFMVVWARDSLFKSRINRTVVGAGSITVVATLAVRAVGWWTDQPLALGLAYDMIVFSLVIAMMAAAQWPRLYLPAAVFLGGAAVAVGWPDWALEATATANLVAMTLVAAYWQPVDEDGRAIVIGVVKRGVCDVFAPAAAASQAESPSAAAN